MERDDFMFEKNSNIDENILKKKKIPILYKDSNWNELFGEVKDRDIKKAKVELQEKVSREREIIKQIKTLQSEKLQCMKMILGVSDSVNNANKRSNIKLLDEYKNKIESLNEEIDDLTYQSEIIPKEIRELNFNLLKETIRYGYDELRQKEKILDESLEEIDILKKRLKELIEIKYNYGDRINKTYTFFHGLLGSEIIEKLDQERLR